MRMTLCFKTAAHWLKRQNVTPMTLFGDALSMTLMVAVSALATLAYGL